MRSMLAALLLLSIGWFGTSSAAEYCVETTAALQALSEQSYAGGLQGEHHIKLVQGTYTIASPDFIVSNGALTVEGGYTAGCSGHDAGANRTLIQGPDEMGRPSFHAFNGGDLVLRDLSFVGYAGVFAWPQGSNASILIQRVAFLFGTAQFDALQVFPSDGSAHLENVLIDAVVSNPASCALRANSPTALNLTFVTLVNRSGGKGACLSGGEISVSNSIVLSEGSDTDVTAGELLLKNSSLQELPVPQALGSSGNSTSPIAFENAPSPLLRYRLANVAIQPARDSGLEVPGVTADLLGHSRLTGPAPDRGAFELEDSSSAFADGFEMN